MGLINVQYAYECEPAVIFRKGRYEILWEHISLPLSGEILEAAKRTRYGQGLAKTNWKHRDLSLIWKRTTQILMTFRVVWLLRKKKFLTDKEVSQ